MKPQGLEDEEEKRRNTGNPAILLKTRSFPPSFHNEFGFISITAKHTFITKPCQAQKIIFNRVATMWYFLWVTICHPEILLTFNPCSSVFTSLQ